MGTAMVSAAVELLLVEAALLSSETVFNRLSVVVDADVVRGLDEDGLVLDEEGVERGEVEIVRILGEAGVVRRMEVEGVGRVRGGSVVDGVGRVRGGSVVRIGTGKSVGSVLPCNKVGEFQATCRVAVKSCTYKRFGIVVRRGANVPNVMNGAN